MLESAVYVFEGRALFIGDRSETDVHSHHAVEVSLALDEDGLDVVVPDGPALLRVPGVIVSANAKHRFFVHGPKVAVFYLEPHSHEGAAIERALGDAPARALPDDVAAAHAPKVLGLLGPRATLADGAAVWASLLGAIAPAPIRPRVDPRVKRALAFVDERLASPPTLAEVASHVGVSSSRLGHLLKAQVGLPLRRYVLWMRLRTALQEALETGNLTAAAYAAGFSDAAHFARTCKRMFGLPASEFAPVDRLFVAP